METTRRTRLERGLWAILPTPFKGADREVDYDSLETVTRHYVASGAVGLVALGVFGEAATLSNDESRNVLKALNAKFPEVPLVVGVSGRDTESVFDRIDSLSDLVGSEAPTYMVKIIHTSVDDQVRMLDEVGRRWNARVVLQDFPRDTGITMRAGDVLECVQRTEVVCAVKSETPPTGKAVAGLSGAPVPLFGGLGGLNLLDELLAGSAGAMTGFSFPEALNACINAYERHGYKAAADVLAPWLPLVNYEGQPELMLEVRKMALHLRGLIDEPVTRAGTGALDESGIDILKVHLERAEGLVGNV